MIHKEVYYTYIIAEVSSPMEKAYEKAINLIKIRPHHSAEITKKLIMRGFDRELVSQVITKLREEKLLDDDQFAESYLESLIRYKSFGFYGIKAKLMQRGISGNEAENLLREKLSLEDEKQIALKITGKSDSADKTKLAQKLQRKGFRSEVIRSSLPAV